MYGWIWIDVMNIETYNHQGSLFYFSKEGREYQFDFLWFRFIRYLIKDYLEGRK